MRGCSSRLDERDGKIMIYLLLAIASSAMVSVCMRMSERHVRNTMVMFTVNYAVCLMIARFYMGDIRLFTAEDGIAVAVGLGLASGCLYLVNFVLLRRSIQYSGVVLSSASMKLGAVLIPVLAAILLFHERMKWPQMAGATLAVLAILLINIEKGDIRHDSKKGWLIALLLLSGLTDTMANIYDKTGAEALKNHYLFYTFLAALFLALAMALRKGEKAHPADLFYGVLIGVPNYYSARFLLSALGKLPAVIVYPVYSVGTIITVTLIGLMIFHERLSRQKAGALGLILVALALLNIP